jgi:hypothetical protein
MIDDRMNASQHLPESLRHTDWMPIVLSSSIGWANYWRTCKPCPSCRGDLSTNGREDWRCPHCGWVSTKVRRRGNSKSQKRRENRPRKECA